MTTYYERLRTVYEHHLDERVKGKQYNFPSPKYIVPPALGILTSPKSSTPDGILTPTGILKSPKEQKNKVIQQIAKSVRFKVFNANNLKDAQKMRYAKEYELREFQKEKSSSVGRE